jgi:hypothetical protein
MQTSNEIILAKAYDLLRHAVPMLNKLPRSQKFVFGDRIQNQLSEVLEQLIRAYYSPPEVKRSILSDVNIQLEILRHYFRLGFDLGFYSSLVYGDFAEKLNEIGRMVGGWLKTIPATTSSREKKGS